MAKARPVEPTILTNEHLEVNTTSITFPDLVTTKSVQRKEIVWDKGKYIMSYEDGTSFMEDLYIMGLKYTADSKIDISMGDGAVYINDGINPAHKVSVNSRGDIIASWLGLAAPLNKPRLSLETYNKQLDNTDSAITYEESTGDSLGGIGLIRCQYTVVSETGAESNPSPASDFINAQFFKISSDGVSDERLIKSIKAYDLNIPEVPPGVSKELAYFKIYYQIIRYSEGVDLDTMEFSSQVDIKNKTTAHMQTLNDYTISNIKVSGDTISFENDTGFPCKTSASNTGIVMVGNIKKSAVIPGDFKYMTPISINNHNSISSVDAVIKIILKKDKIVDQDGAVIFPGWEHFFTKESTDPKDGLKWKTLGDGDASESYVSRHIRIYDQDLTTPIMVYVPRTYSGGSGNELEIYVKIPLLRGGTEQKIYLCWNDVSSYTESSGYNPKLSSGHKGIVDPMHADFSYNRIYSGYYDWFGNMGVHYGRWVLKTDAVSDDGSGDITKQTAGHHQMVFQSARVPTAATEILAVPHVDSLGFGDDGRASYDLINRANTNCHGEGTLGTDKLVVEKTVRAPFGTSPFKLVRAAYYYYGGEWDDGDEKFVSTPDNPFSQHNIYSYEEDDARGIDTMDNKIGTTRGLAPITSFWTTGKNMDDYLLKDDASYLKSFAGDPKAAVAGTLPSGLNMIDNLPDIIKRINPIPTSQTAVIDYFNGGVLRSPKFFYSAGAFKPWCGGWSFRSSAVNIGNMPTTGFFCTRLIFRKMDIANQAEGTDQIIPGGIKHSLNNKFYNNIFYISCGAINDIDATPNVPFNVTRDFDGYEDADGNIQESPSIRQASVLWRDKIYYQPGYNTDNFRPTSSTGAEPGDIEYDDDGVPTNGNVNNAEVTYDSDPITNTDPLKNLITLSLRKRDIQEEDTETVSLRLSITTPLGHIGTQEIRMTEFESDTEAYKNIFVYMSWDILNERFTIAYSSLEDGNPKRNTNINEVDYSVTQKELKIVDSFNNKPLYDIGIGNSTYLNRVRNKDGNRDLNFHLSGYHGFVGTTEMTLDTYSKDEHFIACVRDNLPRFVDNPIGYNWNNDTDNNNITIKETTTTVQKKYENMIMWTDINKSGLPDLNYKLLKEPVIKILSAPSFLKFEYSNTFLIFTRNTINRFVLKGTASGWSGSSESLIEEQLQYGLYAQDTLTKVGSELFWFSEEGVVRWNPDGMQNISANVIDIPIRDDYIGFYCPTKNQYMMHNGTSITYVYDLTYRRWTTFEGLDILSSSILSGGEEVDNINLFLTSNSEIRKYPGDPYGTTKTTQDAHIRTKDMYMESGSIKRLKLDYDGTNANVIYTVKNTDANDVEQVRSNTITGIAKNVWRGTGEAGNTYGRVANIKVENADEIFSILYDVNIRGGE